MTHYTRPALARLTDFFADDTIEQAARQSGFVKRASKLTGKVFVALLTFGLWGSAKTTLAQRAAKATELATPLAISPEALHQRLPPAALGFLQELLRQAFATLHQAEPLALTPAFASFAEVHLIDSTGFELPASLQDHFPGPAGSASPAGAKIQVSWAYRTSRFAHVALSPLNVPDSKSVTALLPLATPKALLLFDLGYFKLDFLAQIGAAQAFFLSRLHHWPLLFVHTAAGPRRLDVGAWLTTATASLLDQPIELGASAHLPCRLVAVRLPDDVVNERRRKANRQAHKKGRTLSQQTRQVLAWNLFLTNVPASTWPPRTVATVYRLRWQVELVFKSWKSHVHVAALNTKKAVSTLCYLYARLLVIVLVYALSPALRAALWLKKQRELSVLKVVRHFQALADKWMQAIFASEVELYRFLQRACLGAERLVGQVSRKRRTTVQLIDDSFSDQSQPFDFVDPKMAVNA